MENNFKKQLFMIVAEENRIENELLSKHTTFKIGGPADYFINPTSQQQLIEVIKLCKKHKVPFYIIGNGSNLLVGDKGFPGAIIQIYHTLDKISIEKDQEDGKFLVSAGAGIMLSKLAMEIAKEGLEGFEFASGIPGTLGGAITMNAGAYGGEINNCIKSATVLKQDGTVLVLPKEQLELGYRTSVIQKESYIVMSAQFIFSKGNKEEILEKITELNKKRREKQPLEYPSAGSTFKRPEGYFAGKLIDDAGLRGYRVGDVMVSEKHCGFVVNVGNGTAAQVRQLISDVDSVIFDKNGVHLEPEVRFVGEF